MKATKLMALGLVGLTTLGLASTVKAEDPSNNQAPTEASITFTTENISEDQDGEGGKPLDPENPIVETPESVDGWKFGVPDFMLFNGVDDNTRKEVDDATTGIKSVFNIYNYGSDTNTYYFAGTKYEGSIDRKGFPIRFINKNTGRTGSSNLVVSLKRDTFMVTTGGTTKALENNTQEKAYINIPKEAFAYKNVNTGEKDNAITTLSVEEDNFKLDNVNTSKPLFDVELNNSHTIGLATMGFAGSNDNKESNVSMYLPSGLDQLKKAKKATVTTKLTWTVTTKVSEPGNE